MLHIIFFYVNKSNSVFQSCYQAAVFPWSYTADHFAHIKNVVCFKIYILLMDLSFSDVKP